MNPQITANNVESIAKGYFFDRELSVSDIHRIDRGHLNDTFYLSTDRGDFVLQRIEKKIFKDPKGVMHNIAIVLDEINRTSDDPNSCLRTVPTTEGCSHAVTQQRDYWRCYNFIEGDVYDFVQGDETGRSIAYGAAMGFGNFEKRLAALPAGQFVDTIPNFHNTVFRVNQLKDAIKADVAGRADDCYDILHAAFRLVGEPSTLLDLMGSGDIPTVVCHNDTKINNIIFHKGSVNPRAVIDLDTLMPGTRLYDFGDLVRTTTCPAAEDETDLSKVFVDLGLYNAIVKGWMDSLGDTLTPAEIDSMAMAGKLITYNIGIRFLTDYLRGDIYFAVRRKSHNLDRARTQFKMIADMQSKWDAIQGIIRDAAHDSKSL